MSTNWTAILPNEKRLWVGGIVIIKNMVDGRHFVIGTANIGKRVRDNARRLALGTHGNPALQSAWTADPSRFKWFVVKRVSVRWMLSAMKQFWMNWAAANGGCYNRKRATPRRP